MALRLEITSEHKEFLGEDHAHTFREDGGTIGRSLRNDWILPDADKYISGNHATIDYQSGAFYLADISTNGVYINEADEPLGKGNPRRLFDGDRLRMGDFEMVVHLDEGEDLAMPPEPPVSVVPDHIEQLVPEDNIRSSIMLLDEEAITGDEEFQAALFGNERPAPKPATTSRPERPPSRRETPAANAAPAATDAELLQTFLHAAGVSPEDIHPAVDPHDVMQNAGQVLRAFVRGASDLLASRANVKSVFRLDQTTVMPRHNNPLKLSTNSAESVKQLLIGKEGEYLGPLDSVEEVCRDLKHHTDAVMSGMVKAFMEFVDRLEPHELEENFDKTLDRKPLFSALGQAKYWQLYCDFYPIVTQKGTASLPQQLAEDFVREYERQIAEYKRTERSARDTQVLDRSEMLSANDDADEEAAYRETDVLT